MWEPDIPRDHVLRQGDLLDYRASDDVAALTLELPITPAALVSNGKRTSAGIAPIKVARALVVSHCCTNENALGGQRSIQVVPVNRITLSPVNPEAHRASLLAEAPATPDTPLGNYNMRELALDPIDRHLPILPANKLWIARLTQVFTFTGEVDRLLEYRSARMLAIGRHRLRQKLMWLLTRPEQGDAAELLQQGVTPMLQAVDES